MKKKAISKFLWDVFVRACYDAELVNNTEIEGASQVAQWKGIYLPMQMMQETWVRSLGQEGPLEEEMVTHPSILPGKIPWAKEPGGLQSMGSQRVGQD